MSYASGQSADKPRSWVPLAGAVAAALVVLIVAVSAVVVGDGLSDTETATIEACEAEYADTGGVAIAGGDVYEPDERRDYYAVAETHGDVPVPLDDVRESVTSEWEAAADRYADSGAGTVLLVWRLEDDNYVQCAVDLTPTGIDAETAKVGPLDAADTV